ncbi:MAG: nucleoside phosphorylase [Chloroflexota bacterium]|nr:nucleoside phosphorylase [Chloroflexota bacterium]
MVKRPATWLVPTSLVRTDHAESSVFQPERLLREGRRQRGLDRGPVPTVCLLDPDGDVVRSLQQTGRGRRSETWACYHTDLWETDVDGIPIGVIGNAVGASFAVLVAEELFASGCRLLVSISSAGQLDPAMTLPCTILVDRAVRGEGTSYAYLPPDRFVEGDHRLVAAVATELQRSGIAAIRGGTWTTDAPFRETRSAIDAATAEGLTAVEMEVAGLYAFAQARGKPVVCFALVTNQMAQAGDDFEKGADNGAGPALALVVAATRGWRALRAEPGIRIADGETP